MNPIEPVSLLLLLQLAGAGGGDFNEFLVTRYLIALAAGRPLHPPVMYRGRDGKFRPVTEWCRHKLEAAHPLLGNQKIPGIRVVRIRSEAQLHRLRADVEREEHGD
jgi:hypothetical protein